ncbi:MAG TPA: ATP synthase subunit I [Candidatus Acidoferrales bacterium]|nr:ATP synthase subunit I [Candidatus Acidoferrales bacterium]
MTREPYSYRAAELRIEWLTLGLGAAGAVSAGLRWGWREAAGVALGAALSWINYRWLKQAITAMAQLSSAQANAPRVRLPASVYVKFLGRFVLLVGVVCVILAGSLVPGRAVLVGLFAVVAAVLVEMIYLLLFGGGNGAQANSSSLG